MKKLIILAHPSEYGFIRHAALAYSQSATAAGHQVQMIDLYKEPTQAFLNFQHIKHVPEDQLREHYQKQLAWADEVCWFFPLWWLDAPAILKNFIDNNLTAGFAYRYENGRPIGLLKGRRSCVFISCDGPKILYYLTLMPFRIIWQLMILRFCGFRVTGFHLFDLMRRRSSEHKEAWLEKIKVLAQ